MPVFISYSHRDKAFVDKLALQLVVREVNVWIDRWELSVGDSLLSRVQDAVVGASALIVVLSKASVESAWCREEVNVGLDRQLKEKRTVVLPVLLEDCAMPAFLTTRMYADFRTDFDFGLRKLLEAIAKVTNPSMARFEDEEQYRYFSTDIARARSNYDIRVNIVQVPTSQPYICAITVNTRTGKASSAAFERNKERIGLGAAQAQVMKVVADGVGAKPLLAVLSGPDEWTRVMRVRGPAPREAYRVRIGVRWLGEDTGKNVLVNVGGLLSECRDHMLRVLTRPSSGAE